MTRFDEISPLWDKLKCLGKFFEVLFSIWQKLVLTLVNFVYNWAISHCSKWTNNENYKTIWSHLLVVTNNSFELDIKGFMAGLLWKH